MGLKLNYQPSRPTKGPVPRRAPVRGFDPPARNDDWAKIIIDALAVVLFIAGALVACLTLKGG